MEDTMITAICAKKASRVPSEMAKVRFSHGVFLNVVFALAKGKPFGKREAR